MAVSQQLVRLPHRAQTNDIGLYQTNQHKSRSSSLACVLTAFSARAVVSFHAVTRLPKSAAALASVTSLTARVSDCNVQPACNMQRGLQHPTCTPNMHVVEIDVEPGANVQRPAARYPTRHGTPAWHCAHLHPPAARPSRRRLSQRPLSSRRPRARHTAQRRACERPGRGRTAAHPSHFSASQSWRDGHGSGESVDERRRKGGGG